MTKMQGVYLPMVTPFSDGAIDYQSLQRLVDHYSGLGLSGLILLGTTGEAPTIERAEQRSLITAVLDMTEGRLPVYAGVSGNSTKHVADDLTSFESFGLAGYLVVTPYYSRPSADGLVEHFRVVAGATERPIIIYNVPYRTGVNLTNDTLFEIVATTTNVRAIKDTTGDIVQSLDLLHRAPADLAVLTGEDLLYLTSLTNGADGGILASAHLAPKTFVEIHDAVKNQEIVRAREAWSGISPIIPSLFSESNPMPLKYCLWRLGLLRSPECRLPLTRISGRLAETLDKMTADISDK